LLANTAQVGSPQIENRLLDEIFPITVFRDEWRPGLTVTLADKDLRPAEESAAISASRSRL
jgi:hypothetical protein